MNEHKVSKSTLILDAGSPLAEGPIWDDQRNCLWWVDIIQGEIHQYLPDKKTDHFFKIGEMLGAVALDSTGGMLLAMQSGLGKISATALNHWIETGTFPDVITRLVMPEPLDKDVRFNDGKCDPAGRFWAGTMGLDAGAGKGKLYSICPDGTVITKKTDVTISNGLAWDISAKIMYYIDTATQSVVAFDYDYSTGSITNERTVIVIPKESGAPDGMTIDSEGRLWIALWGGAAVECWNPRTGSFLEKISVPAPQVTSCIFGGKDYKTLYITTARVGMQEEVLSEFPQSGGLFSVSLPVSGLPTPCFDSQDSSF